MDAVTGSLGGLGGVGGASGGALPLGSNDLAPSDTPQATAPVPQTSGGFGVPTF